MFTLNAFVVRFAQSKYQRFGLPLAFASLALFALWLNWSSVLGFGNWLAVLCALAALFTFGRARQARQIKAPPRRAFSWKNLAGFVLALAATIAASGSLGVSYAAAHGLVHPARARVECSPEARGLVNYEAAVFHAADGLTLRGWYIPTQHSAVVILMHGLNRNRCRMLAEAALLSAHGYGVLLYDARNAGESDGDTTTFGVQEVNDVIGAVDFVKSQPGVAAARIGLFGHSLGGATALMAAARLPEIRAVVAESTFSSLDENIAGGVEKMTALPAFPFAPLVMLFGQFEAGVNLSQARPIDAIAALGSRPVLIAHGALDDVVPVSHAYRLYAAAPGPKELFIIPNLNHYCCLPAGDVSADYLQQYTEHFLGFLDKALLAEH
jgi:dipeptidyl aminopeptidase/acylaminoacyl peptidase